MVIGDYHVMHGDYHVMLTGLLCELWTALLNDKNTYVIG